MAASDNSSVCRSSLLGGSGGHSGSGGKGSSGRAQKPPPRKGGWEDAGVEFYREAYPTSVDNVYDARITTLLPSKRQQYYAAGRGTAPRRFSTRRRRMTQPSAAATLIQTSKRGSDTYLEVMPDLTQGVDEEQTWEKMQQIRDHSVSMKEKRKMKRQLQSLPALRMRGWASLKLYRRKWTARVKQRLQRFFAKAALWHWSLRHIEGHYGTGLSAFFAFIKWLLYVNLFTCVLVAVFIFVPDLLLEKPHDSCLEDPDNTTDCCHVSYHQTSSQRRELNHLPLPLQWVINILQGSGVLEVSPFFYGYYPSHELLLYPTFGWHYNLPLAYLLVVLGSLALSLGLLVRAAASGLTESLRSSEGQFYKFNNLVFGGWDFCIRSKRGAVMKRCAVFNEIRNALETEKEKDNREIRTKSQRLRMLVSRIIVNSLILVTFAAAFAAIFYSTKFAFERLSYHRRSQYNAASQKFSSNRRLSLDSSSDAMHSQYNFVVGHILFLEYLPSLVVITLNAVVPFIFSILIQLEHYTTNFALLVTLVRNVFLRLVSLLVLLVSVYEVLNKCHLLDAVSCSNMCSLQPLCWETYVGQQLYKLILLDLLAMTINVFFVNLPRRCLGRHIWHRSRLGAAIGTVEWDVPKNVMDIVYGQTLCWLGVFYCPMLPVVGCIKLVLTFYIKYFDVTMNSKQTISLYRASRTNALFVSLLLIAFIVTIIPVGYSMAEIKPSASCGPFRTLPTIWSQMVAVIAESPQWVQSAVFFIGTAGFAVPMLLMLTFAWYYSHAVAGANKHMVELLKNQLVLEGHDKQYLLVRLEGVMMRQGAEGGARGRRCEGPARGRSYESEGGGISGQSYEADEGGNDDRTLEA